MTEFWLQVKDFPDAYNEDFIQRFSNYNVSNLGRVRNVVTDRIIKLSRTKQGAVKVGLYDGNGKQYTRSLKLLVAHAFVPGYTHDLFNTPIHLDGDQVNCNADNLIWRPRWFAWKYARQFENIDEYVNRGPIYDCDTSLRYNNIAEAAMRLGLLCKDIHIASIVYGNPVFPTFHKFAWVKD